MFRGVKSTRKKRCRATFPRSGVQHPPLCIERGPRKVAVLLWGNAHFGIFCFSVAFLDLPECEFYSKKNSVGRNRGPFRRGFSQVSCYPESDFSFLRQDPWYLRYGWPCVRSRAHHRCHLVSFAFDIMAALSPPVSCLSFPQACFCFVLLERRWILSHLGEHRQVLHFRRLSSRSECRCTL